MLGKASYEVNNNDEEIYQENLTRIHAGDSVISK